MSCTGRVPSVAPDWEWPYNITGALWYCRVPQDMGDTAPKSGKPELMPTSEECVQGTVRKSTLKQKNKIASINSSPTVVLSSIRVHRNIFLIIFIRNMALYIFRLLNIQWLFLTTSLWGRHWIAVTILHVDRGREVCNKFCTIKLMKFNSLNQGEALSDLNENRTVRQSWYFISCLFSLQSSRSNSVASPYPPAKKHLC